MREVDETSSGGARCSTCGAEQEVRDPAGDGTCVSCGAELVPSPVEGGDVAPRPAAQHSTVNSRYAEVRRQVAGILQDLRPGDVDHATELAESAAAARKLSPRTTYALVALLVLAGLFVVASAIQFFARRHVAQDADRIAQRIESYRSETGLYPDAATWQQWVSGGDAAAFLDPWQRPYLYAVDSRSFSITTYGADGSPGGSWRNKDLTFVFRYTNPRSQLLHGQPEGRGASE